MPRLAVLLDACVLYPAPLRDLLIQLATAQLFRARWTERIHDEWISDLLVKRQDLDAGALAQTRTLMNAAVLDCLVEGYDHLIPTIELPDPDDRHVMAAAIHGRCDAIVTFNTKDFPVSALARYNLETVHPDDFISRQFDQEEAVALIAARKCRRRLRNPPIPPGRYLDILLAQSLPKTVAMLWPRESLL